MLSREKILELIGRLNAELAAKNIKGELYLVGGAVMCTVFNTRPSTKDIDGIFAPKNDVYAAVKSIAEETGESPDWLNDSVKGFLSMQNHDKQYDPFIEMSNLRVFAGKPEYILAMKCMAARTAESKDITDIRDLIKILDIKNGDDVVNIVKQFYPFERIPQRLFYLLDEVFESSQVAQAQKTSDPLGYEEWEILLKAQRTLQEKFPDCVLVGGTAAAMICNHRISTDADHVLCDLKPYFANILARLEQEAGWKTNRIKPPVLILGHFQGVETGIRQLIRHAPLETMVIRGITVPTPAEMARVKGYLTVKRNATRDYIDFIALADHLGDNELTLALDKLDQLYPQSKDSSETMSRQLAKQLAEPKPYDLDNIDLSQYKGLKAPYVNWVYIKQRCQEVSMIITDRVVLKNTQSAEVHRNATPKPER